jgi:hypothetical protein
MIREIVLSSTYRQSSKVTEEMLAKDAADKYYERAPRVRLSAEQVGLIIPKETGVNT